MIVSKQIEYGSSISDIIVSNINKQKSLHVNPKKSHHLPMPFHGFGQATTTPSPLTINLPCFKVDTPLGPIQIGTCAAGAAPLIQCPSGYTYNLATNQCMPTQSPLSSFLPYLLFGGLILAAGIIIIKQTKGKSK